jgi:hypothetical protein
MAPDGDPASDIQHSHAHRRLYRINLVLDPGQIRRLRRILGTPGNSAAADRNFKFNRSSNEARVRRHCEYSPLCVDPEFRNGAEKPEMPGG